jgi:putative two-component system response regulator
MKILLVEDSKPIRMENGRALVKAGYEVVYAEDGEKALALARSERPDLILLDLLLPRMGGLQVLEELKGNPATVEVPVIVVSSLSGRNASRLIEAGAEDYIEKSAILEGGRNHLPNMLVNIVCKINRKRGTLLLSVPLPQ